MKQTVVVNQSMTGNNPFSFNLSNQLGFTPKKIIIRQVVYANIAGADLGTYLLWCSLTNRYIGSIYVGIQATPSFPLTEIDNLQSTGSVIFRLDPANAAFTAPTGNLTITLECVSD